MKYFKFFFIFYFLYIKPVLSEDIKIHAPFAETYSCIEHWKGQFRSLGDALGTDCIINGWNKDNNRLFMKPFKNNGFKNEDWFGFRKDVLSPCDCIIQSVHINPVINVPGKMTPGRASSIIFKSGNNINIVYAHVREVLVAAGDSVEAGQVVAKVGNNGYSRNPHIHIGAWNSQSNPLQIKFDQSTINSTKISE